MKLRLFSYIFGLLLVPASAFAQGTLFISPTGGTYGVGELFSVTVNVNTGAKAINAASAQINFDNSRLEVTNLGYSQSLFNIWTQEPTFSNPAGTITFSGGLPSPGFTGASGALLRITFKAKAVGQAPITFVSGSVLANDGKGTNILDNLKGALFTVLQAVKSQISGTIPITSSQVPPADTTIDVPIITDWPKEVEEGQTITIQGLGTPFGKILVAFQPQSEDQPERYEDFAGPDGRFQFTYPKSPSSGTYQVWARNVNSDGVASNRSEPINISVTVPLFFRIGTLAINYGSIIITLLGLLALLVIFFGWAWVRLRKWQRAQGKEVGEAEAVLHQSFDTLRNALAEFVKDVTARKSLGELRKQEPEIERDLKRGLEKMERKIEKEIKDIEGQH